MSCVEVGIDWQVPLYRYLTSNELPNDPQETRELKIRAARFTIISGVLYKQAYTVPFLKCLGPQEAEYTLVETNSGVCGEHLGARALV